MVLDPLTQLEDGIIAWLNTDSTIASYNWQRWESDKDVEQPRGYVNVTANGDLDLGMQGPTLLQAEVVLEGKPKRGSQAEVVAIVLAMLSGREIIDRLNNKMPDGSVAIVGPPEAARVEQAIERDVRLRRFTVIYPAIWGVVYV
jgi:hypothetical protein